jgi:hypothetical protein
MQRDAHVCQRSDEVRLVDQSDEACRGACMSVREATKQKMAD